jgi:solute:Na+ symporter, SSS family
LLLGIVVAGLLAGGISTYDSVGSALSAVFTRDVYARFLVKRAADRHYVWVSRIATFAMIGLSFIYIPFMEAGIVELYLKLTGVAVVPLLTVYMLGVLTPVHRSAGTIGLLVGIACGISRFSQELIKVELPQWWSNSWWGYLWSIGITAATMLLVTVVRGRATTEQLRELVYQGEDESEASIVDESQEGETWLDATHREMSHMPQYSFEVPPEGLVWYRRPGVWAILLLAVVAYMNLVVAW